MSQNSAGVPLGRKFVYRWTDAEPTGEIGIDSARKNLLHLLAGLAVVGGLIGAYLGGLGGAALGAVALVGLGGKGLAEGFKQRSGEATRFDNEHITRPVEREARIVFSEDQYFFVVNPAPSAVLGQSGAPLVQRWQDIDRLVRVPFWETFGIGRLPDVGGDWTGIAMYPVIGPPAPIASTTAGEGKMYGVLTELNSRFGPEARAEFFRLLEIEKRRGGTSRQNPTTNAAPNRSSEVPKEL